MVAVKLFSRLSLSVALITFASVGGASAEPVCRAGVLYDAVTGRPVIDPVSKRPARCGGGDDLGCSGGVPFCGDNTALAVGAAALVVGGTIAGLGASGAFSSNNNPPPVIPPLPLSHQ
ncbi:MAG: hypothetical protein ACR652_10540 [Methylocystis sp.]|uniref:hypothetical protein n=1 Tax=Methylocystis sp. TaxID=1911079 RepID=UPI003DA3EE58